MMIPHDPRSTVYFIRPIGMDGPVKIGCSRSPYKRLVTLETWCPFPLEIVAEIKGDTLLERRFHARFRASHMRHEWFRWTPGLAETIDLIGSGAFDVETLPDPERVTHIKPRDNSYSTPGWRYGRSIASRIQHLRARGLPWKADDRAGIPSVYELDDKTPEELAAIRAQVEPIIARWQREYPKPEPKMARAS